MKAVTVWQPWASLIAAGAKRIEFRRWRAPRALVGSRIAIHAGARQVDAGELADLIYTLRRGEVARALHPGADLELARALVESRRFPLSAVVATAVLGAPARCVDLYRATMDPADIDPDMWAWPLAEVERVEPPAPARGQTGFWEWTP